MRMEQGRSAVGLEIWSSGPADQRMMDRLDLIGLEQCTEAFASQLIAVGSPASLSRRQAPIDIADPERAPRGLSRPSDHGSEESGTDDARQALGRTLDRWKGMVLSPWGLFEGINITVAMNVSLLSTFNIRVNPVPACSSRWRTRDRS